MPSVRDATAKPTLHRLRVNARLLAEALSVQVRLHGWILGHEEPDIDSTAEASLMTGLLLAMLLIGVLLLSLVGDLGLRDLERSSALAEAALRRALEDP